MTALSCWLFTACSDDNTVFNEPPQIRAYEADAEVLSQFVEVDSRTGLFSINPNKKVTATDYVVNRSREQLAEVSSINRTRFEGEMEQANNLIKAYAAYRKGSAAYSKAMIMDTSENSKVEMNASLPPKANTQKIDFLETDYIQCIKNVSNSESVNFA